jgi:hypothetical protein
VLGEALFPFLQRVDERLPQCTLKMKVVVVVVVQFMSLSDDASSQMLHTVYELISVFLLATKYTGL